MRVSIRSLRATLVAGLAAAAACASTSGGGTVSSNPPGTVTAVGTDTLSTGMKAPAGAQPGAPATWRASIMPQGGTTVHGTAIAHVYAMDSTVVSVLLTGGTPGAVYPWHVHTGSCASGGPVLGAPPAYQPLTVTSGGTAAGGSVVTTGLTSGKQYHVNIHASPTAMGTIIGCGDLVADAHT